MTTHHPPREALEARARGAVEPALAVMLDAHLALCAPCRAAVTPYTELGGALLADTPATPMSSGFEDSLMSRLDEAPRAPSPAAADPLLPPAVAALARSKGNRWRVMGPGVQAMDLLDRPTGLPLRLARMAGGSKVPVHDHTATERLLVLGGGWTDPKLGHFGRGDLSWLGPEVRDHGALVDEGEPCVALMLNDAPLRMHNLVWRAAAAWFRF